MSSNRYHDETPNSSGHSTPALSSSATWTVPSTVSHAVTGLLRRFSTEPSNHAGNGNLNNIHNQQSKFRSSNFSPASAQNGIQGVYTPPHRTASPFQPPPLYPVTLRGWRENTDPSAQLLSRALAEEIRLLVPPRLQLCEEWNLVYSLEQDGVSLGTLYKKCDELRGLRNGFVLVVRDGEGGLFGAYLTEAPHPAPHYFGTGECFLWRATLISSSLLANLPPPPSSDTTHSQRSTTIGVPHPSSLLFPTTSQGPPKSPAFSSKSGTSTPERIRFKAFPYSGINDYLMLCETGFLSIGGGDGHYGLWLDDTFEKGISSSCPTFGNEPLSEEGEKFDILGVEVWSIGN
ncbi:b1ef07ff-31fb-4e32-a1d2-eda6251cfc14 [Sclerotinia trifoliorum]|uniref:Oxidation resistance protein 1 n=1 Tax=Sclerotinia trifoliorum TaxID=28548 RepID=A0A8H2VRR7_9HELO|nr:b1ef07ff-31fb-4e32-a1d2-eda6251cfc14 [Sclerotinia trifoliorum]